MSKAIVYYIASKSQSQAKELRTKIEQRGRVVNASWIDQKDFGNGPPYDDALRAYYATIDLTEARTCDQLILISENGKSSKGGRHVETGVALALEKPVHLIGEKENIFHWHPLVRTYVSVEDFIRSL